MQMSMITTTEMIAINILYLRDLFFVFPISDSNLFPGEFPELLILPDHADRKCLQTCHSTELKSVYFI